MSWWKAKLSKRKSEYWTYSIFAGFVNMQLFANVFALSAVYRSLQCLQIAKITKCRSGTSCSSNISLYALCGGNIYAMMTQFIKNHKYIFYLLAVICLSLISARQLSGLKGMLVITNTRTVERSEGKREKERRVTGVNKCERHHHDMLLFIRTVSTSFSYLK